MENKPKKFWESRTMWLALATFLMGASDSLISLLNGQIDVQAFIMAVIAVGFAALRLTTTSSIK